MSIELSIIISILSCSAAIYFGWLAATRNKSSDDKKQASDMTTVIVKLESIQSNTAEIKADMRNLNAQVRENRESIIRMDESLKSAWKAINKIQGKGDTK